MDEGMFRFRRLAGIALEDFGLRRAKAPAHAPDLPAQVVWHGAARRSPELQRFCDELEALRQGVA